jgi:hypothetical protein
LLFSLLCLVPCSFLYYQVICCLFYLACIWMLLSCVFLVDKSSCLLLYLCLSVSCISQT